MMNCEGVIGSDCNLFEGIILSRCMAYVSAGVSHPFVK
jgi:hypothetical protein